MENEIRLAAANLLLQRGVKYKVDAPFWQRLTGRNVIHIKPLFPGTIAAFSLEILKHGLENATQEKVLENISVVARVIAIAILNDEKEIEMNADELGRKLLWKVPANQLLNIYSAIENVSRVVDFTIITNSITRMMQMMMNPKLMSLGQDEKGS
ncbi:MAG: hypothetical protein EOM47_09050 [Bacteroidia bacterium]|nr:hypothetical protein [Bacteroidia bacterium]